MIRKVALFASLSILASCSTPSPPRPTVDPPKPLACDPRLESDVPATPKPPAGASIVQPVTMEERAATSLFLGWVAELADVAGQNERRSRLAKAECEARR